MKCYIGIVKIPERMWRKNGALYISPLMGRLCKLFRCSVNFKFHFGEYYLQSTPTAKYYLSEMQDPAAWGKK